MTSPKRSHENLPLFILWSDFTLWLFERTEKFPKSVRLTLTIRLENYCLDIYEVIVEARYTRNRMPILKRMDLSLEKMRLLLRFAQQRKYLSMSSYEYAAKQLFEAGKMLGGWIKTGSRDETGHQTV
ncbi:diversity-generating retroelement protein Avd [candidate division CSSED10-310 bacterium]|uniref:Diversity-generating retroelement protein Avd n=1 Tax=candidate division CSSED10-310 bacterium TaxID=2855610 RepID=A0ABV6Z340_UNCC1